jgi:hypothetical protein
LAVESRNGVSAARRRRDLRVLLVVFAVIETVVFAWVVCLGRDRFVELVVLDDTPSYARVAWGLLERGTLIPARRTLGYPLFLCAGFLIGGKGYGYHVTIGMQLLLNLVFSWLFWRLLLRVVDDVSRAMALVMTSLFFVGGLGFAIVALSDLLAALLFTAFLYGMLSERSWPWTLLSGLCLGLTAMLAFLYIVGLSSFFPSGAERIRLPALAFMLPVAAMNLRSIGGRLRRLRPSGAHAEPAGDEDARGQGHRSRGRHP